MTIFKTTSEILDTPWEFQYPDPVIPNIVPDKIEWHGIRDMKLEDVEIWEQIYYQGGNIGIYAAWKPYGELYMITYNLYMDTKVGYELVYGPEAASQIKDIAKQLGVDLEVQKIWVDDLNKWMYDDYRLSPT